MRCNGCFSQKTTQCNKESPRKDLHYSNLFLLQNRVYSVRSHNSAYQAIRRENKYSDQPMHCKVGVEIDWRMFHGIWYKNERDIGKTVKIIVFDEILIRALCSANSSNRSLTKWLLGCAISRYIRTLFVIICSPSVFNPIHARISALVHTALQFCMPHMSFLLDNSNLRNHTVLFCLWMHINQH
jgi:hypothetical protein